jgi:hypothetical protein
MVWNFTTQCDQILIKVERTDIQVLGSDASAIQSASMRIRGRLSAVQLQIIHGNEDSTPKEDGSYALVPKQTQDGTIGPKFMAELQPHEEPIVYLDVALSPTPTADVYLLPVCTKWRGRNGSIAGLILRKKEIEKEIVYERMGVFCLDRSQAYIVGGSNDQQDDVMTMAGTETVILI